MAWVNRKAINPAPVILSDIGRVNWGSVPPRTIRWMENKTNFKGFTWTDDPYGYKDGFESSRMEPGRSNAWNGYLIFEVPAGTELKDIQIAGWFGYYGSAYWNLEARQYIQDSPETAKEKQIRMLEAQRTGGIRLSDRKADIRRRA